VFWPWFSIDNHKLQNITMHLCLKTTIFNKKLIIISVFVKFLLPYVLQNRFCINSMVFLKFLICTFHFYITCFRMVLIENLSQEGIIQKIFVNDICWILYFWRRPLPSQGETLYSNFSFLIPWLKNQRGSDEGGDFRPAVPTLSAVLHTPGYFRRKLPSRVRSR